MSKKQITWVFGLAAAIAAGATHAAGAQSTEPDSVRPARRTPVASSQRIKISKEAPGEVAPPDTITPPPPPPPPPAPVMVVRRPLGFFAGVGGGLAFGGESGRTQDVLLGVDCIPGQPGDPAFDRDRVGYSIAVPFGWQPIGKPLGVRFDVGYSSYHSTGSWLANDGSTGSYATHPQIWTADADARLKLGSITRRLSPYVIGGLSYGRFRTLIEPTGSDPIDSQDQSWHNSWGYNAGGGLEYMLGRTGLFVESRYFHLNGASGFNSVSHVPLIVGLTWY